MIMYLPFFIFQHMSNLGVSQFTQFLLSFHSMKLFLLKFKCAFFFPFILMTSFLQSRLFSWILIFSKVFFVFHCSCSFWFFHVRFSVWQVAYFSYIITYDSMYYAIDKFYCFLQFFCVYISPWWQLSLFRYQRHFT